MNRPNVRPRISCGGWRKRGRPRCQRLDDDSAKRLKSAVAELYEESTAYPIYEGSIGASPREMRTVLLDAAQDTRYACLSPFAVLDQDGRAHVDCLGARRPLDTRRRRLRLKIWRI